MAKKLSQELKDRLMNQRKEMGSGMVIDNKHFTKMRLRILPMLEDTPGKENISFYCEAKKKGTTSPRTFGLACPILDFMDKVKRSGSKEDKDHAKGMINITREYWMGVIDQENPGKAESPTLRILRAKRSVYEEVIKFMMDEDDGEDITDPKEGRDIRVKKEGSGMDTQWTVKFLDRSPLSEDQEYVDAVIEAAKSFDPADHFFKVDYEVLGELYMDLTGEPIPDQYLENVDTKSKGKVSSKPSKAVQANDDEDAPVAKSSGPAKKKAPEPEPEEEAEVAATEIEVGASVEFDFEGNAVAGEVVKDNGDGSWDVKDGTGEVWGVNAADLRLVAAEEPEEEPEPAPAPKAPAKKTVTPPATTPAPKAATKAPVKPSLVKASGSIKERLAKAK